MRKLFLILTLGVFFIFPALASAQANVTLSRVDVQLWPEYDQPSMLVIVDFQVDPATPLPVDLTFRIPPDANVIAVAALSGNAFMNAPHTDPKLEGEWQVFTMTIESGELQRYEYYQPITRNGNQRLFSYLWDGAYAADEFQVRVLRPLDTISLETSPAYASTEQSGSLTYFFSDVVRLSSGEQFAFNVEYEKTTPALINPPQGLQSAAPLDESTPGRVSLNNYLPYIIGGIGVIMIAGGIIYYWQSGRRPASTRRSRRRILAAPESEEGETGAYCPQCGARAKPSDRFCRTCGSRLRSPQE